MIAGQLEIQMLANMARLADDMHKAQSTVGGAMKNIESLVGSAKDALGALGIGLSVGYFANLIKGSIDAMDHLNDLSKTTSIAVEQLAGLKLAAKQSGGDLDSIAASINKLSVNMGKDAATFKAAGISAKDPLEAFKQLSDIFVAIKDPQLRAALGAEALGKSWAGAAPLLSEGSQRIQEMVDKGTRLSGMTQAQAEKADELNDRWEELVGTGGALNTLVGKMLEPLLKLTNQMIAARDASDGFLGTIGRFFSISGKEADNPEKALTDVNAKLLALRKTEEEFAGMGLIRRIFSADDIVIVRAQIAGLEAQKSVLEGLLGAPFPAKPGMDPAAAKAAAEKLLAGKEAADKAAKEEAARQEWLQKKSTEAYMRRIQEEEEGNKIRAQLQDAAAKEESEQFAKAQKDMEEALRISLENEAALMEASHMAVLEAEVKKQKEATAEITEFWRSAARSMQGAMSDFFFSILQRDMTNLGASFKRMVDRMMSDYLAAQAATGLFGKDFGKGGGLGGLVGMGLDKLGNKFLGATDPATGFATDTYVGGGLHWNGEYAGGTNFVPQTGLALVHQGEKITPASENNSSNGPVFYADLRGTSVEAVARLEAFVRRVDGTLEQRAVAAVFNAQQTNAMSF